MARAVLEIVLDSKGNVQAIKQAGRDLEDLGEGGEQSSNALDKVGQALSMVGGAAAIAGVASMAADFVQLGADVEASRARLEAFAGGAVAAEGYLEAFQEAADGTVDRMSAMQGASKLLGMGLVDNADEMGLMAEMATKLGDQTTAAGDRVNDFSLLLANQSVQRLDNFNISSGRVRKRIDELLKSGQALSRDEAFKLAVMAEGRIALEKLGDQSELTSVKIQKIKSATADAKQGLGELAVSALAGTGSVDDLAESIRTFPDILEDSIGAVRGLTGRIDDMTDVQMIALRLGKQYGEMWVEQKLGAEEAARATEELRWAHTRAGPALAATSTMQRTLNEITRESRSELEYYATAHGIMRESVSKSADSFDQYQAALDVTREMENAATVSALELEQAMKDQAEIAERMEHYLFNATMAFSSHYQSAEERAEEFADRRQKVEEEHQARVKSLRERGQEDLLGQEQERYERELAMLAENRQKQEESQRQSLGRMVLQHFGAWAEMHDLTSEETLNMQLDIAEKYGLIAEDAKQRVEDMAGEWNGQLAVMRGEASSFTDHVIQELDRIPRERRIKIIYELGDRPETTRPGGGEAMQHGGPVRRSDLYLVGERGPEMVALPRGAYVYDAQQTEQTFYAPSSRGHGGGGGQINVYVSNHFGRDSVRSDEDIEEITRAQERIGQLRGVRIWEM